MLNINNLLHEKENIMDEYAENIDMDYVEIEDVVDDESSQTDYVYEGDVENPDINYLFGDIGDIEEEDVDEEIECSRPKYNNRVTDLTWVDSAPVFDQLDKEEQELLPLNYIVSPELEWKFIQEACASGFRNVKNLSRVSNKTLKLIADISQYTLNINMSKFPRLNTAFIEYAEQRGV